MDCLVGCTGFVGQNLILQHCFDRAYHATDIRQADGLHPQLCVYAGVRSEKYIANKDPIADRAHMQQALDNIRAIAPQKLVLISTVDVLRQPIGVDEMYIPETQGLQAYGANRLWLEQRCREEFPSCTILRLPGLFGVGLKKNLLYDLLQVIPAMLTEALFETLALREPALRQHYTAQPNGFYKCICNDQEQRKQLRETFVRLGFTAANFTDSRSVFQFYDLSLLWGHLQTAVRAELPLLHLATEPISAAEAAVALTGKPFENCLDKPLLRYDFKTCFGAAFHVSGGYLQNREQVLDALKHFGGQMKEKLL